MEQNLLESVEEIALEAWRFERVFQRMLSRMDPLEAKRYASQYQWFRQKVDAAVEKAGLHMVNLEGQPFDAGMAATPLNLDEFDSDEWLVVRQTIEPVVMHQGRVRRTGTVILGRADE